MGRRVERKRNDDYFTVSRRYCCHRQSAGTLKARSQQRTNQRVGDSKEEEEEQQQETESERKSLFHILQGERKRERERLLLDFSSSSSFSRETN